MRVFKGNCWLETLTMSFGIHNSSDAPESRLSANDHTEPASTCWGSTIHECYSRALPASTKSSQAEALLPGLELIDDHNSPHPSGREITTAARTNASTPEDKNSGDKSSKTPPISQEKPSLAISGSEATSQQIQQKLDKAAQELALAKTPEEKKAVLAEIGALDKTAVGNLQTLNAAANNEFTELSKPYPEFTAAAKQQKEAATKLNTEMDKLTPAQHKALDPEIASYVNGTDTASQKKQFEQKLSAQGLNGLSDALKNVGHVVAETDAALAPGEHIEATLDTQFGPSLTSAKEALLRTLKLEDQALRENGESPEGNNAAGLVEQQIQGLTQQLASADPDGDGQ
jgi:hypothetical protein